MKEAYKQAKAEFLSALGTTEAGLSAREAEHRLHTFGENRLKERKKRSLPGLFFAQFKDLMTLILLSAALLSGVLALVTGELSELADTGILLFVILLNAVVGFVQEYRADAAIEKLKTLSASTAKVVRDGRVRETDASLLVPGDVVELSEGDRVPADCRVIGANGFRVDESALTGESKPVSKRDCTVSGTALAERENMAHMGSFCVAGEARCVVAATGMRTEMGKIADLMGAAVPVPSPLDKTVAKLGKLITAVVLCVSAVLFLGNMLGGRAGFLENLMSAVALAVAAIPEGMGAVVTVILAMGVQRMSRRRTVVRKLSAVETLGSCTCVCSDKTGTLTKNKMTAEGFSTRFAGEERYTGTAEQKRLLTCVRLCHTVKGEAGAYLGDPTEIALVEFADRCGFSARGRSLGGIPFSSERKCMSVAADVDGKSRLFVKGGADVILKKCVSVADGEGSRPLTRADASRILEYVSMFSAQAKRVLAFAEGEFSGEVREEELTFLGVIAMIDPPKEGAKESVEALKKAGVRTVMITGDSARTAFAIAERLGVASREEEVMTGEELDALGEKLSAYADRISVYARVSPGHKQQIVRALQARGEVVAMTGDGVNDAPSVRAADVGVAMGSGTDVTKNAADMVVEDDDFSTIVGAVEEGRNVFLNIKRTVSFFLSTNFAEVFAVLFATLFLWRNFLTSTQLLWINLITDSLPVLALGVERTDGVMSRPPVTLKELFGFRPLFGMFACGAALSGVVLGLFAFAAARWGNAVATTCAFASLSFVELFHAFNVRRERGRATLKGFFSNKTLNITVLVGILLNVILISVPPFAAAFDLAPLSSAQWLAVFVSSLAVFPIGMLARLCGALSEKAAQNGGARRARPKDPERGTARGGVPQKRQNV